MWNERLRPRATTRSAGAVGEDVRRDNPLDLLYASSDESEGEGRVASSKANTKGFTFSPAPGSPMDATENDKPYAFSMGAGTTTSPKHQSRRAGRSKKAESKSAPPEPVSSVTDTPPASPVPKSPSPESPPTFNFFGKDNTWPRSGSRNRNPSTPSGGTTSTPVRRSDTTPSFGATPVRRSDTTPPEKETTPFGASAFAPGDFSPFGFAKKQTPPPFSPVPNAAATSPEKATPFVEEIGNLSFIVGAGGGRRTDRGSTGRGASRSKPRGASPKGSHSPRGPFTGDSKTGAFSATPKFPSFFANTSTAPNTGTDTSTAPTAAFAFTPPPPAAISPSYNMFGPGVTGVGTNSAPFAAAAPGLFTPGVGASKPSGSIGKSRKLGSRTPKKKQSGSAASTTPTPPRSPAAAATARVPPSIFSKETDTHKNPNRSPVRRVVRPWKPSSPPHAPPSIPLGSPMDVLRESLGRVALGRSGLGGDAGASTSQPPQQNNVSFTFVSEATRLKDSGNAAFKAGRYNVAQANYEGALERMAREFPTETAPCEVLDACLIDGEVKNDTESVGISFVAGGRDAAVCYANRAAVRLMNVNGNSETASGGDSTQNALAAASDVRRALRDCRAALAADQTFCRARIRAGTCLMRLGAFTDARVEFLKAAEGTPSDSTSREATRLAQDAQRGKELVDDLTKVDGGALAMLRRNLIEGASLGARRVKARVWKAAGGDMDAVEDSNDETHHLHTNTSTGSSHAPQQTASQVARSVLRRTLDISAVAPHCASVAESKARALLFEGRFTDSVSVADKEGLGGACHTQRSSSDAEPSFADEALGAFTYQTGREPWRAFVRTAARFATGDLLGAAKAFKTVEHELTQQDLSTQQESTNASDIHSSRVMNDDASSVAFRVAQELEKSERGVFAGLAKVAIQAHALRVEGNSQFKQKDYVAASKMYTNAIKAVADYSLAAAFASVCLCNRAAAAHATGAIADALADCGRALVLNPTRLKSLSRRAQLRFETRLFDHCIDDLQRLLITLTLEASRVSLSSSGRDKNRGSHDASDETEHARLTRVALQDSASGTEPADITGKAYREFRDAVTVRLKEAKQKRMRVGNDAIADHVAILGLRNTSGGNISVSQINDAAVKKAYRKLALKHHPDKSCVGLPSWVDSDSVRADADQVFKMVGEANNALCTSDKRGEYIALNRKMSGASRHDDFGFGASTFARDAGRYGGSRGGGYGGGGRGDEYQSQSHYGGHSAHYGGASSAWGDWFSETNRAAGRGAYGKHGKAKHKSGGYKT